MNEIPSPAWTKSPKVAIEHDDASDATTVSEVFQLARLAATHPIVAAWHTADERSRRLMHQLAEDARLLRRVVGFSDLCKKIRTDIDGFEDSVYELRVAGTVARGKDQEVLRLGGSQQGPDIVFRAQSGHECGIACYRARSEPPSIKAVGGLVDNVLRRFGDLYRFKDLGGNCFMQVLFPEFPIRPQDESLAMAVLGQLWSPTLGPEYQIGGVRGRRVALPAGAMQRGDGRLIRLRLEFPISAWDRRRVLATVSTKMKFEADRWASSYGGIPLFAVEESHGAHGSSMVDDLKTIMAGPDTFAGILLTHNPNTGLEYVEWIARQTGDLGLRIQMETLWENMTHHADGRPIITYSTGTAFVDHDFRSRRRHGTGKFALTQVKPFGSEWLSVRLPPMGDFRQATSDPRFIPAVQKAFEFLRNRVELGGPKAQLNEVIDLVFEDEDTPPRDGK